MKIACSCMVMVLMLSGCATTGKVDQMIDTQVSPQIEALNAQVDTQFIAQTAAAAQTLEDMKGFMDRLGSALNKDVKAIKSDIADLETQIAAVKKEIGSTKSGVKGLEAKVSKLETAIGSANASDGIDSLKEKVAVLNAMVEKLNSAEKARTEAEAAAAKAKAALPAKGFFHRHPAGTVE